MPSLLGEQGAQGKNENSYRVIGRQTHSFPTLGKAIMDMQEERDSLRSCSELSIHPAGQVNILA